MRSIEVVWTSGGIDKLEIYRRLGVPEVWSWQDDALVVHVLQEGSHRVAERSAQLPGLNLPMLLSCLEHPTATQAMRAFRELLGA